MSANEGKNVIVTKVYDENCDICKHMQKHDRATFESYPEIGYQEITLDNVIEHNGNLTKVRLYQILERYCLSPTYEIDLPVYVFTDRKGTYLTHQQGAATVAQLRDKVKECLEGTSE